MLRADGTHSSIYSLSSLSPPPSFIFLHLRKFICNIAWLKLQASTTTDSFLMGQTLDWKSNVWQEIHYEESMSKDNHYRLHN